MSAPILAAAASGDATALKACCAAAYAQDWVSLLLGDSLHPGGLELTRRLGTLLQLGPDDRVLDLACGLGATSVFLATEFGCHVTGVDYGAEQVDRASEAAAAAGVSHRTAFRVGDAENLPFDPSSFTAVICECSFCTFPSKDRAAAEMGRVLAPGGRLGLTDLTVNGPLPEELQGLAAWVACVADARPVAEYAATLAAHGFATVVTEDHPAALSRLIADIQTRLLGVTVMARLGKVDLGDVDLTDAQRLVRLARDATRAGTLSYGLITATTADRP